MKPRHAKFLTLLSALLMAAILLRFPPDRYSFYPQCPIHALLHLQCPGCGGTRAVAALLRGDFTGAWHQNALILALLPFAAGYGISCALRAWGDATFCWPEPPRWTLRAALALAVVFTIARNLPR